MMELHSCHGAGNYSWDFLSTLTLTVATTTESSDLLLRVKVLKSNFLRTDGRVVIALSSRRNVSVVGGFRSCAKPNQMNF